MKLNMEHCVEIKRDVKQKGQGKLRGSIKKQKEKK